MKEVRIACYAHAALWLLLPLACYVYAVTTGSVLGGGYLFLGVVVAAFALTGPMLVGIAPLFYVRSLRRWERLDEAAEVNTRTWWSHKQRRRVRWAALTIASGLTVLNLYDEDAFIQVTALLGAFALLGVPWNSGWTMLGLLVWPTACI